MGFKVSGLFLAQTREKHENQGEALNQFSQWCLMRCIMGIFPRMPSSALIPFLGAPGSPINPFKQKGAPFLFLGYWAT